MQGLLVNGQRDPIGIDPCFARFSFVSAGETLYEVLLYENGSPQPSQCRVLSGDGANGFAFSEALRPETAYLWTVGDGKRLQSARFATGVAQMPPLKVRSSDANGLLVCKSVSIPTNVTAARLYLAGSDSVWVTVNGEIPKCFCRSLPPSYQEKTGYRTASVESLLWRGGENTVCFYAAPNASVPYAAELRFFTDTETRSGYCF